MKRTEEKLFEFIKKADLIRKNDKLLVGFSGGPDSVFCLNFLHKYREKYKIDLAAIHVNHMIRKSSAADADFCRKFCVEREIPFFIQSVSVRDFSRKNKVSLEEAGRILRYNIFNKIAEENSYNKIVTAHNLDDNAETVLLNFTKGCGINGLKGIPIRRGNIIRPMLCVSKKEVLEYLRLNKIEFVTDESNFTNDFQRNYLRNEIIPKLQSKINPNFSEAVFRLTENTSKLNDFLEQNIKEFLKKKINRNGDDYFIKIKDMEKLPSILLSEVIRNFFIDFLQIGFVKSDLTKILRLITNQKGRQESLKKNWTVLRESNFLHFMKLLTNETESKIEVNENLISAGKMEIKIEYVKPNEIEFNNSGKVEYIDADKIEGSFTLRKWKAGDKFIPLGMKNPKKLSDFLTDLKLTALAKKNTYLLLNRNKIVWVVGLRISEDYKITSLTKKIIRLTVN